MTCNDCINLREYAIHRIKEADLDIIKLKKRGIKPCLNEKILMLIHGQKVLIEIFNIKPEEYK